ncbi:MAG: TonB-dependent receptor [Flavobacteriaceae bacterium]|nr:TonB-dependent receptor [Flavobacteriaceae bacterium]MDG2314029.1 TonB-dependent receptor [Flavobacteriaceae bacterium]
MKKILFSMALLASVAISAQTVVKGTVTDNNNDPIPGANIVLGSTGSVTDFDGNFSISVDQEPPFSLQISSIGFETTSVSISAANLSVSVQLSEANMMLDEIVMSASRLPERIFESPVTVEKFDYQDIQETASSDFYTGLESLKGVQIRRGGLLLNQVNVRGFGTLYTEGFVQLVDGMDNAAPVFGFAVGNLIGLSELDVQSVELLPGAASALYGADAYKGIMFMNSKNPFDHEGVSAYYKTGITSSEASGSDQFYDVGIRMAKKFNDKFAAKATFSYVQGREWVAADYVGSVDGETKPGDTNFNAVNVYGELPTSTSGPRDLTDDFSTLLLPGLQALGLASATQVAELQGAFALSPNYFGSAEILSSGYKESDLVDNKATNFKTNLALHYKPSDDSEWVLNTRFGGGSTVLQADGRYKLDNFKMFQHKIEYNNRNLNVRFYSTIEDSGNTHQLTALAAGIVLPKAEAWYGEYLKTYILGAAGQVNADPLTGIGILATEIGTVYQTALLTALGGGATMADAQAAGLAASSALSFSDYVDNTIPIHTAAREAADQVLIPAGSDDFNTLAENLKKNPVELGVGSVIVDNSRTHSFEANYNMQDLVSFGDMIIGTSVRATILDSEGTLFTDYDDVIGYRQYGAYAQIQKEILGGAVKLTGSARYDKSEFFEGNFTPRIGALIGISDNQNIRISYQTGFRNPTNQDQYIALNAGDKVLMGSSPDSVDRFNMDVMGYPITGAHVFATALNENTMAPANLKNVESEFVRSLELGYRLNTSDLSVDVSAYFSDYDNFIAAQGVYVPLFIGPSGTTAEAIGAGALFPFAVDGNIDEDVKTLGASISVEKSLFDNYSLGFVYEYNKLDYTEKANSSFEPAFNTPENQVKVSLAGTELFDDFSFNISARYYDDYFYESSFIDRTIESNVIFDAQVSMDINAIDGVLKIGGANVGGDDYVSMPGSGMIGNQYYVSLTLNP